MFFSFFIGAIWSSNQMGTPVFWVGRFAIDRCFVWCVKTKSNPLRVGASRKARARRLCVLVSIGLAWLVTISVLTIQFNATYSFIILYVTQSASWTSLRRPAEYRLSGWFVWLVSEHSAYTTNRQVVAAKGKLVDFER